MMTPSLWRLSDLLQCVLYLTEAHRPPKNRIYSGEPQELCLVSYDSRTSPEPPTAVISLALLVPLNLVSHAAWISTAVGDRDVSRATPSAAGTAHENSPDFSSAIPFGSKISASPYSKIVRRPSADHPRTDEEQKTGHKTHTVWKPYDNPCRIVR